MTRPLPSRPSGQNSDFAFFYHTLTVQVSAISTVLMLRWFEAHRRVGTTSVLGLCHSIHATYTPPTLRSMEILKLIIGRSWGIYILASLCSRRWYLGESPATFHVCAQSFLSYYHLMESTGRNLFSRSSRGVSESWNLPYSTRKIKETLGLSKNLYIEIATKNPLLLSNLKTVVKCTQHTYDFFSLYFRCTVQ